MVDEGLLTTEEAAAYLGITPNYLRQLQFRKKVLWTKRVGGRVYYNAATLEQYKSAKISE